MDSGPSAVQPLPAVTVVMPALDEEQGVATAVTAVRSVLERAGIEHEMLVVDDGSTDATAAEAARAGATVLSLPEQRGYGAALKTGIAAAKYDLIVIIDADCSYPAEAVPVLLAHSARYDMVVGARIGPEVLEPGIRRPMKWFLRTLASYLAGRRIPDLNSGLRVLRRDLVERFSHVLPSGFSFTTSITLAAHCSGALVRYEPIDYRRRVGRSKIRPYHAAQFLVLVIRSIVYFNPLRVFLPAGGILFVGGMTKLLYDFYMENVSDTAAIGLLGALIVWTLGLLSDQIARIGARSWIR
jgi:glycosyltransferase involved in cell wall biosynthesis